MSDSMSMQRPALPSTVRWAVLLIGVSVVPGVVDLVSGRQPPAPGQPSWFAPAVGAFSVACVLLIAMFIAQGRGWARVLLAVLFVLGVPAMLAVANELSAWLADRTGRTVLLLLQSVAQLVAVILLFLPEASAWFRAVKLARKSA